MQDGKSYYESSGPQQGTYAQNGGYAQQATHAQQGAYSPQAGFSQPAQYGNAQQGGYSPQSGYGQSQQQFYGQQGTQHQAYGQQQMYSGYGGQLVPPGSAVASTVSLADWGSALLGTGGMEGEPPLLEELNINFRHMLQKTLSVLNPMRAPAKELVEDSDGWGPLMFALFFGASLLAAGKALFSFIYGLTLFGCTGLWGILNLMSSADEHRITWPQTMSILGYCLLPITFLSWLGLALPMHGPLGLIFGGATVLWCTASSSSMFVTALSMREQRILVAYPIGLFYSCFALMTIF